MKITRKEVLIELKHVGIGELFCLPGTSAVFLKTTPVFDEKLTYPLYTAVNLTVDAIIHMDPKTKVQIIEGRLVLD